MTIEEMKQKKRELGYSNSYLAELSGVPLGTVQKIFAGSTKYPRRDTLIALEHTLSKDVSQPLIQSETYSPASDNQALIHDPQAVYKTKQGYTLEDYLALPEERRVELIDGVFYDMAAPTTIHQAMGGFIYKKLLDHVLEHKGTCMPFMSPVDVQLDSDDKTVVQPDVLIVCDRNKFKNGRVFGAPDFLIEILSPSTRKKDMQLKLYKYGAAGVREYWMVDPYQKKVVVYDFEHEAIPVIYGFEDKVPVMIWDNQCEIDFSEIYEHISFLYD